MNTVFMRRMKMLLGVAAIACIAGCGGGGGSSTPAPSIAGFWSETNSGAIVLANGDAWVVPHDQASFSRIQLTTSGQSFTGTGTTYALDGSGSTAATSKTGTFVEKSSITGLVSNPLSYQSSYETAAPLSNAVGSWQASYNGGANVVTLTVAATTGLISGSSTTGCSYSGTLQTRAADPSVYDVSYAETCGVSPS